MTDPVRRRDEVGTAEDRGWQEFRATCLRLSAQQMLQPGYYPEGWSAKDLVNHLGTWMAEATQVLEQLTNDTYRKRDLDVDAMNARFLEATRPLDLESSWAQLFAARTMMLTVFGRLPEASLSDVAFGWFEESGPRHYEEHLPRLQAWVDELTGAAA